MIKNIISKRSVDTRAFFDICYEWEDEISKYLKIPIVSLPKITYPFKRGLYKLFPEGYTITQNMEKDISLYFVMFVTELKYYSGYNGIPIFIDVWGDQEIDFVISKMKNVQFYYVTSLDVYNRIKEKTSTDNVHYIRLSVPDKYYSNNYDNFITKKYDVIQMGRKNPYLHKWMLEYIKENPNVEYIYTDKTSGDSKIEYISTKNGIVGELNDREKFISMLSQSRISLVSSPAADNSRKNNGGIDYPTPRFYESAALGCYMIGRYTPNDECLCLCDVCKNIQTYEEFKYEVGKGLSSDRRSLFISYKDFIESNITSERAKQISEEYASFCRRRTARV